MIFEQHTSYLNDQRLAILLSGNLPQVNASPYQDIDYIVISSHSDYKTLERLGAVRQDLQNKLQVGVSNTITSFELIKLIDAHILMIDPKAVQAIIQNIKKPQNIIANHSFSIPIPEDISIKKYSKNNFFNIRAQTYKHILRADTSTGEFYSYKLLKLCMIAVKMRLQFLSPRLFIEDTCPLDVDAKNAYDIFMHLDNVKSNLENNSDHIVIQAIDYITAIKPSDFDQVP